MSAPAAVTARRPAVPPAAPARFGDLVASEWIKMRSLRSTPWTLALAVLFVIGSAATAALGDYSDFPRYSAAAQHEHVFALGDAFPVAGYLTLMLAAASVGAIATASEYSSGLIRTTTVAVPARGSVVLAKAVVAAAVWTAVGVVAASSSFGVSQAILSGRHAAVSFSDPGVFRAWAASALLAPVCAVFGLGLGAVVRHSATVVVAGAFILLMLPAMFAPTTPWAADVLHAMLRTGWVSLAAVYGHPPGSYPVYAPISESWIDYAVWPSVALAAAVLTVRKRDV